jgi:hypothetical protein
MSKSLSHCKIEILTLNESLNKQAHFSDCLKLFHTMLLVFLRIFLAKMFSFSQRLNLESPKNFENLQRICKRNVELIRVRCPLGQKILVC